MTKTSLQQETLTACVAQSVHAMLGIAAPVADARVSGDFAQCAERVCEALSAALHSPVVDTALAALLLGCSNATIDALQRGAIDMKKQCVVQGGRHRLLPLLLCDALLTPSGLSASEADWILATQSDARAGFDLRHLRHRFVDVISLAGHATSNASLVSRRLTSSSDGAHRACTMIDIVSLLCCTGPMPSERTTVLREALGAVLIVGWEHARLMIGEIAAHLEWRVHDAAAELTFARLTLAKPSAREKLHARGVLRTLVE